MEQLSDRKLAMARWVIVDFDERHADRDTVHRIGNLADDLWVSLRGDPGSCIPLDDNNRPTTRLAVAVVHRRDLSRVRHLIEMALAKHGFTDDLHIHVSDERPGVRVKLQS